MGHDMSGARGEGPQLAVLTIDSDRIITSWNPGAARLLGYPAGEMVGSPLTFMMPPQLVAEFALLLHGAPQGRVARVEAGHDAVLCQRPLVELPLVLRIAPGLAARIHEPIDTEPYEVGASVSVAGVAGCARAWICPFQVAA